jgi:hypothetical protein
MSQNLTTITKNILGPGHVMEDANPTPIAFRNTVLNPPVVDPVPIDPQPPTPHPIP